MNDEKTCKIKITGDLSFDGQITLPQAHKILGIIIGGDQGTPLPSPATGQSLQIRSGQTIKTFLAEKKPTTDVEKIACLAYFLTHKDGKSKFNGSELEEAATQAAIQISNFPRAIDNATRQSKFLAKAGDRTKQIASLGEAVVEALPDRTMVAAVIKEMPRRRRKSATRKKKQ